jgi:hypothetical protein
MLQLRLKAANGKYVTAEHGGGSDLVANRDSGGPWETFTVVNPNGSELNSVPGSESKVALRVSNGKYMKAQNNGGSTLDATADVPSLWETFTLVSGSNGISFRAGSGHYLCADLDQGGKLLANRSGIGAWETFTPDWVGATGNGTTPTTGTTPAANPFIYNDLEIGFASKFQLQWNDQGSGGDRDAAFYRPLPLSGYYPVGDLLVTNYNNPDDNQVVVVVRDISGKALQPPTDFELIWVDRGSGANMDGSIWRPIAPAGYKAMGYVCNKGYSKPSTDTIRCVRSDLVMRGFVGDLIWSDQGSGAEGDTSAYGIICATPQEGEATFSGGTFLAINSYNKPGDDPCANTFRLKMKFEQPAIKLPEPKIDRSGPPSLMQQNSVTYAVELPWHVVQDPGRTDVWRLANSPTYRLVRTDTYKLAGYLTNPNGTRDLTLTATYEEGWDQSETSSFSHTTGISIEHGLSIGKADVFSISTKVTFFYSFTYSNSTTTTKTSRETKQITAPVVSGTALAIFVIHSQYQLFRKDGSPVGGVVTVTAPNSFIAVQDPPATGEVKLQRQ